MLRPMFLTLLSLVLAQQVFAQGQVLPAPGGPSINTALQGVTPAQSSFYVALQGQQTGPHDMNGLQQMLAQGTLTPQSLVWTDGMPNWAPAGTIPALAQLFAPVTPAPPPVPGPNQPNLPPLSPQTPDQGGQQIPGLDALAAKERQDFGIPASNQLHTGAMHGPTPSSIPGGKLITTKGLVEMVQATGMQYLIFDVLGGQVTLPGAIAAAPAAQAGSFQDQIQQQMGNYLQQATGGNKQVPLVFYCQSVQCWMSYNASLRAIQLGYTNVLWYRGGLEAWQSVGLPTAPAQQGNPQQNSN